MRLKRVELIHDIERPGRTGDGGTTVFRDNGAFEEPGTPDGRNHRLSFENGFVHILDRKNGATVLVPVAAAVKAMVPWSEEDTDAEHEAAEERWREHQRALGKDDDVEELKAWSAEQKKILEEARMRDRPISVAALSKAIEHTVKTGEKTTVRAGGGGRRKKGDEPT